MKRISLAAPALVAALSLIAACGPENESGVPITGLLAHASGDYAPVTLVIPGPGEEPEGTGFEFSATLDGALLSGSGAWACYAPFGEFPNFDVEAVDLDRTWGFFLSVSPAVWSTGTHLIDGDDVQLLVAAEDRFGVATSGSVTITEAGEAPDTPGSGCSFTVSPNITLEGERDR